jgi:uncharacterized protein (DUF983 family)
MVSQLPGPAARGGSAASWQPSARQRLWALVAQRCPRCCRGRIFRGLFQMNDPCPVCGLILQREEGYFLGAMYVSYLLGAVVLGGAYFLGRWLLPGWNDHLILLLAILLYLPLTPIVFRYARSIWMHFERGVCPGDTSLGAFERARMKEKG